MKSINFSNSRVLITGGAGFIGSELVRQLVSENVRAVVVDNLINGRAANLEGMSADMVQLVVADVRDGEHMTRLMRDVEIVFHLACLGVRHSLHSPFENHDVNATGTLNLLLAARAAEVRRFVFVSSSEVYGTARRVPMTEEHPTRPTTVYGASKLAGESYTRAFYRTYGLPTVVVRPFNTYGPRCHHEGDSGEVIPKFLLRGMAGRPMVVFGDGAQTRDFSFVSDTARGILLAGFVEKAIGETINLGCGHEIAINNLARQIATIIGSPGVPVIYDAPRPGDVLRLCADATKGLQLLGYRPKVSLEEGLVRLKDWYLSFGKPPEFLLEDEKVHNWEGGDVRFT